MPEVKIKNLLNCPMGKQYICNNVIVPGKNNNVFIHEIQECIAPMKNENVYVPREKNNILDLSEYNVYLFTLNRRMHYIETVLYRRKNTSCIFSSILIYQVPYSVHILE